MKKEEILALGSVVTINNAMRKIMIVSRSIMAEIDGQERYFDYGACFFPEGVITNELVYFNHEDITEVITKGNELPEEEIAKNCVYNAYIKYNNQK